MNAEDIPPGELLDIQADTLFRYDEEGRMTALNEHGDRKPPRVWVGVARTGETVVRLRDDTTDEAAKDIEAAVNALVPGERLDAGPLLRALERHGPVDRMYQGPAFHFPVNYVAPFGAMQLYPGNAAMLHPSLATLGPEIRHVRPCWAVLRDGQAVSVCYSARTSARAAEAGVETAADYRGMGAAPMAVDAWADAVAKKGLLPLYSTRWDNIPSRAVAAKLGLIQYAENFWAE